MLLIMATNWFSEWKVACAEEQIVEIESVQCAFLCLKRVDTIGSTR
jgi:hypothetical protein